MDGLSQWPDDVFEDVEQPFDEVFTMTIDTEAMIADALTMPDDRQGIIEWHMERGATREHAEIIASQMLDETPNNVDR